MFGNRLLVVDDDHSAVESVRTTAAAAGFVIYAASDCAACRRAMLEFRPTLILLSVSMARIDAVDTLRVVLDHRSSVPILLTSVAEPNTVLAVQRFGQECGLNMVGHVAKPISERDMQPVLIRYRKAALRLVHEQRAPTVG